MSIQGVIEDQVYASGARGSSGSRPKSSIHPPHQPSPAPCVKESSIPTYASLATLEPTETRVEVSQPKSHGIISKYIIAALETHPLFSSFSKKDHYSAFSLPACSAHSLDHANRALLNIKANNEVNFPNVQTFFTHARRNQNIVTTFTKAPHYLGTNKEIRTF